MASLIRSLRLAPGTTKMDVEEEPTADVAATKGTTTRSKSAAAQQEPKPAVPKKRRKKLKSLGDAKGTEVGGFTVIGDVGQFRKQSFKSALPSWLSNPYVVSSNLNDDQTPIESLGLCPHLTSLLQQNFISYLFPVQQQVVPWVIQSHSPKLLRPSDICVSAPTGSGKTLAYVLPLIHILRNKSLTPKIQAIVVLATDILASQIFSVFTSYCAGTDLKVFHLSKKASLKSERRSLVKVALNGKARIPYNIIVTTPGRLIDHLEHTEEFDISHLEFLVVDEADRTLDDQQGDWLHRLEVNFWSHHGSQHSQWIPLNIRSIGLHLKSFHKLLFSATLSQNSETLEALHLFQPKLFTSIVERENKVLSEAQKGESTEEQPLTDVSENFIGKYTTPLELKESFILCRKEVKPLILAYLITKFKWKRVLCFVNTKENTHRLCVLLRSMGNVKIREISSKWTPFTRDLTLKKFASGGIEVLVTSDQMSRGIDIPAVDYVISYDLPSHTKTYIHRIGRTARAGRVGNAVSLVETHQVGVFKTIMKSAGKTNIEKMTIKNSDLKPLEESFKAALNTMKTELESETTAKGKGKGKPQSAKATKASKEQLPDWKELSVSPSR